MTQSDLITRNLQDQLGNFGSESVVANRNGSRSFVDPLTGRARARAINASYFDLSSAPVDNSFALNPNQYAVAVGLFQAPGVSAELSNTYGAVAAVTAKSLGVSPTQVYANGRMSQAMIDNVNFFRTASSQIGYNSGSPEPPYLNNLMLHAKISNQTT